MKSILRILEMVGGYRGDLYLRIDNPPYMTLVIKAAQEPGPCGAPALSVAHCGEQNGDLMRDPEMCLEVLKPFGRGTRLSPFYYRNDYLGVEQFSRSSDGKHYTLRRELYVAHQNFATLGIGICSTKALSKLSTGVTTVDSSPLYGSASLQFSQGRCGIAFRGFEDRRGASKPGLRVFVRERAYPTRLISALGSLDTHSLTD